MNEGLAAKRWLIAAIVVMLALVEVLDMTIVSVALQDMQGALSAAPDQITWTVTAYVVSAAILMPLTGLLSARFGRKQVLISSACGFTFASFLCGLSQNLWQIVLFRACQGAFGALLPPLAQATLADTFQGEDFPKAMALFAMGLMVGPILGPILGGYIAEDIGWRYIFFINIPIGMAGAFLAHKYLPLTPKSFRKLDLIGLILLALGVGGVQYILDRGNELNWFQSTQLMLMALVSGLSLLAFIVRGIGFSENVIRLSLFQDKNFVLACLAMFLYCACFLGTLSWVPLWLELFLNYSSSLAGLVLMPRGIACLLTILISSRILKYVDVRYFIVISSLAYGFGMLIFSRFNLNVAIENLLWPNIFMGIAAGLFFVPINALAYQSLAKNLINDASGLLNFFRSAGSSVGVAIFTTVMTRQAQISWNELGQHMNPFNPALYQYIQQAGMSWSNPQTYAQLGQLLYNQGYMQGFINANYLFAGLILLVIPCVLLMDKRKVQKPQLGE